MFLLNSCNRFNGLGLNSLVLSKASPNCFAVKEKNWSESCHQFLKRCSDAGNAEASYTLGMVSLNSSLGNGNFIFNFRLKLSFTNYVFLDFHQIRFYCLQNRGGERTFSALLLDFFCS